MWIGLGITIIVFLFLYLKSRKIQCEKKSGISTVFYKMSLYILGLPFSHRLIQPQVKKKLRVLNPTKEINLVCSNYYAAKLSLVLLLLFFGTMFITIISYTNQTNSILQNNNQLQRGDYDATSEQIALVVESEDTKDLLPFEVKSRKHSKKEINKLANEFTSKADELILGDNQDPENVKTDLILKDTYEGYPFEVDWMSDDYTLVDSDGTVYNENLKKSQIVMLTANIKYEDYEYEHSFSVCVQPKVYSGKEERLQKIRQEIEKADRKQSYKEEITLPEKIENKTVTYAIKEKTGWSTYFLLLCLTAGLLFWAKDNDLKKEMDHRNEQIVLEYPEFVSQFVLLLGAGMTVRNIFEKINQNNYCGKYLGQEIQILVRDLHNGILESEALDRFGKRCGNSLYIKFCALLIQNLKKGTKDLLPILEGESEQAFLYRKQNAKRLGEEAGTKLLVPMILMLGIVMLIIMVPAFLSFQL